jgi:uncharacterized membrane protein YidH (DUF202 family)
MSSAEAHGLPNERTTMAWQRTALSFVAAGALIARQSGSLVAAAAILGGVALVAGWTIAESDGRHHGRGLALESGGPVTVLHHVAAAAATATILALTALVIVLT